MRRPLSLLVLPLLLSTALAGCGDDTDDAATDTTNSSSTTETTSASSSGFTFSTADGTLVVAGEPGTCDSADATSLAVTVMGDRGLFTINVTNGSGSVRVNADGTEFEGTVDSLEVGDDGAVTASGRGSTADDSAGGGAKEFTISGSCA